MGLGVVFIEEEDVCMRYQLRGGMSVGGMGRKERLHTASTPCLPLRPMSTLNTQWLRHFRSRARPSRPTILLSVVLTERPSTWIQSNGAGLFVARGALDALDEGGGKQDVMLEFGFGFWEVVFGEAVVVGEADGDG